VLEILLAGGWAMLPILICSAVAIAIILERFWSLRRTTVIPPKLGAEVREWARTRQLDPDHIETLRSNSPLGEILAAALSVRHRAREIMKERVEDTGRHVVHRLERFLNTLGTIALISPLLGLLGTVFGLIEMFFAVMVSGVGDPLKMAGGIGQALVCTATGLCVAIPAYFFHRYFRGLVSDYVVDMEQQVILLMDELTAYAEPLPSEQRLARTRSSDPPRTDRTRASDPPAPARADRTRATDPRA
jgi:biopolymer transport protein ExbB